MSSSALAEDRSQNHKAPSSLLMLPDDGNVGDDGDTDSDEDDVDFTSSRRGRRGGHGGGGGTATTRTAYSRPSVGSRLSEAGVVGRGRRRSSLFLLHGGRRNSTSRRSSILGGNSSQQSQAHLNELYRKAIRMNAENRINATNSWSINLIEHIDKFLEYDPYDNDEPRSPAEDRGPVVSRRDKTSNTDDETSSSHHHHHHHNNNSGSTDDKNNNKNNNSHRGRVNFTKASCTLDASIKIYSYRVDDVHLTSYKVLANLNRNDQTTTTGAPTAVKEGSPSDRIGDAFGAHDDGGDDGTAFGGEEEDDGGRSRRKAAATKTGPTLENNLSNINMNKLDSAFDIDPLFHKMSKTFDEGGAKGLLLVNLGLGSHCNIVFDSSSVNNEPHLIGGGEVTDETTDPAPLDVTTLVSQLDDDLVDLPLVPQLASLRAQRDLLGHEGFDDDADLPGGAAASSSSLSAIGGGRGSRNSHSIISGRRYAAKADEENMADVSIHQEAVERSQRFSAGRTLLLAMDDDNDHNNNGGRASYQPVAPRSSLAMSTGSPMEYAPDDYGGGGADDDDYNDYGGGDGGTALVFDDDMDVGPRYSSVSFAGGITTPTNLEVVESFPIATTSAVLDKLSSCNLLVAATSDYEYLNHRMLTDNEWAGTLFWKHKAKRRQVPKATEAGTTKSKPPSKKAKSKKPVAGKLQKLLALETPLDLSEILIKPKPGLLQWSRAILAKHGKDDHLLPLDAGMGVEQLTQLFLRPDVTVHHQAVTTTTNSAPSTARKTVGFDFTDSQAPWNHGGDDASYGGADDDDGPGYQFEGPEDNGADTGAFGDNDDEYSNSGIDPTRIELQGVRKVSKVQVGYATVAKKVDVKRLKRDIWNELQERFNTVESNAEEDGTEEEKADIVNRSNGMSFQEVVQDLEADKSQVDASLPFYFICILHLANEKGLRLKSEGLENFQIYHDEHVTGPSF